MKTQSLSFVRASISFPGGIYQNLKNLAQQKKVSLAWIVREAVERYVAEEPSGRLGGRKQTARANRKLTQRPT